MPLNTTNFLVLQGWEGVGVPLDGKAGKGLKKPLAITQKKTLSGIGKDRDRADDWWNSIFTAGAKSLSIGPSPASSGVSTPTLDKSKISTSATSWNMGERSAASTTMSLSSLAKREHARKTLMSKFVRGKPIVPAVEPPVESPKPEPALPAWKADSSEVVAASDAKVNVAVDIDSRASSEIASSLTLSEAKSKSKSKKHDKDAEQLARKLAKKALRKQLKESDDPSSPPATVTASDADSSSSKSKSTKSSDEKKDKKDKKAKKDSKDKDESKAGKDKK
ncbi:hypothetical protein, partial [Sporisorium scitamineum]